MGKWQDVNGDETYAIDWPLNSYSTVCEVGAYEGRWSKQIMKRYNCTVHAFEPQSWAVVKLIMLQKDFPKLIIHPYALGNRETVLEMGEFETDACSFLLQGTRKGGKGEMRDAAAVLAAISEEQNKAIDLMMMNIEGYEYELAQLPVLESGAIRQRA
jgi:FkbM family methyltransferase